MGTDVNDLLGGTPYKSVLSVEVNDLYIMTISLSINNVLQNLSLNSLEKASGTTYPGILLKVNNSSGSGDLKVDLKSYKALAGDYVYAELQLSNGGPNPRVIVKYSIPK